MKTEIFIEGQRLDVSKDISTLLNFGIDDIKDFSSRSTSWSKTIILPGTGNNNNLFGNIFQVGQSNFYDESLPNVAYNFNASKGAECLIFQDNLQTFKGVLRLLEIINDKGRIEYEVAVFGEISALNVALSSKLLEDLDFSEYDHEYSVANILSSWDAPKGEGYTYPLIDYGTYSDNKKDWDIRTLRPALYVKEYIDKMFTAAGFRYQSALMETARFKGLVIPNNRKALYQSNQGLLAIEADPQTFVNGPPTSQNFDHILFQTFVTPGNFTTTDDHVFVYGGSQTLTANLIFEIEGEYYANNSYGIAIYQNGVDISANIIGGFALPATGGTTLIPFSKSVTISVNLNPGDFFSVTGIQLYVTVPTYQMTINSASIVMSGGSGETVEAAPGGMIDMNYNLPKNIRQIDFLVSIIKLFNIYVYEDKFDSRLIYMKPYVDYYDATTSLDWTYKLNRNKPVRVKPMSELNAKIYEFKFKQDGDYYNDLYFKRYGQTYGSRIFDSLFEFTEQKNSLELIFASTPLVGLVAEDKVYPTICKISNSTEEKVDSIIRILQTKKIEGVTSWAIKNDTTTLATTTSYMYGGHLDDPDAPDNDLNFGAPQELFFTVAGGNLSKNQFNLYWSDYMAEITDKDSKLVTGYFYLTPKDILELDFAKYIQVDGVTFRINSISDYNASMPSDCKVELLKVSVSPSGSQVDFDTWSQDGLNDVDDGLGNDIIIKSI